MVSRRLSRRLAWMLLIGAAAASAAAFAAAGLAAYRFSAPALRPVGPAPDDLAAKFAAIERPDAAPVAGWFVRGEPGRGAVLLLHSSRSDRRQMVARASMLRREGLAVMLIDLPAHGESPGDRNTFGWNEAKGVRAAYADLRRRVPAERVGIIGTSLGAAAAVLARLEPPPDAMVLEAMYPTIEEAIDDRLRMRIGPLAALATPLLLMHLPLQLGVTADQLRPIDHVGRLGAPVLIAAGTLDRHTTPAETRRLHEAAAPVKELWLVEGAAHVDLHAHDAKAYEAKVLPFLGKWLGATGR
jgi:uncharacterized protein